MNLDHLLDQVVALRGTAGDAHMGAVLVLREGDMVYIEGLPTWDELSGKTVEVIGTLTRDKLAPDPVVNEGAVSHGAFGMNYVLRGATWKEVPADKVG